MSILLFGNWDEFRSPPDVLSSLIIGIGTRNLQQLQGFCDRKCQKIDTIIEVREKKRLGRRD